MQIKRHLFVLLMALLSFGGRAFAQVITPEDMDKFHIMEDSMVVTADSMYKAFIPDAHVAYSERFVKQLVRTLKINNSYYYPFDKLKDIINIIYSDDQSFRVFNWEIVQSQVLKVYYGAVQLPSDKLKLYGLRDYTEQVGKGAEDSVLTAGKWMGSLIYRIMTKEVAGKKIHFFFGLNSSNVRSNKKMIDPMMLTDKGPVFGAPVFGVASENFPRQRVNRFVLEYKKEVRAGMNWDETRQVIVFDKLISQVNDPSRKYTYVPSGQYDGMKWVNDGWVYLRDLIPVNAVQDGQQPDQDASNPPKQPITPPENEGRQQGKSEGDIR